MAIGARVVLVLPTLYACLAEKLILAFIAFYSHSILSDDLIANTAEYEILDIRYLILVHNAVIRK